MTTPSSAQALGLSFNAWLPAITPGTSYMTKGSYIPDAFGIVNDYQHTLDAINGYSSASLTMSVSQLQLESWLYSGLNRHIEVTDHALDVIFEGFVNKISASAGAATIDHGPMTDVANRVRVVYSTVDTSVDPPAVGMRVPTAWAENATSQARYGTLEEVLSTSGQTADNAEQMRDTHLADYAEPKHKQTLTFPAHGQSSITIEVLGYIRKLEQYVYNQTTTGGLYDLSTKLAEVLAAQPDSLFGTGSIATNTIQVKRWENDNNVAWGLVKSLAEIGDTSDNRYTFGIYENRRPVYAQVPTDVDYSHSIFDPEQGIMSRYGGTLKPWNILPGRWLEFTDFMTDQRAASSLQEDPHMMFIESVTYSTPWNLTLHGGRVDTISQQMARMGISGAGGI